MEGVPTKTSHGVDAQRNICVLSFFEVFNELFRDETFERGEFSTMRSKHQLYFLLETPLHSIVSHSIEHVLRSCITQ